MVRETAARLWSYPWFYAARLLIFVDSEVTASNMPGVAWQTINTCEFTHDSFSDQSGKRLALDATGSRMPRQRIEVNSDILQRVSERWKEYGLE